MLKGLKVSTDERRKWASEIKSLRAKRGWTQLQLASVSQVSIAAVQKIEYETAGGRALHLHLTSILKIKEENPIAEVAMKEKEKT